MNRDSGLFTVTRTFVKIAYGLAVAASIILPLIALVAAISPGFLGATGTGGLQVDAVGMKIDLSSGVDPSTWRAGMVVSFATGGIAALAMLFVFGQLRQLLERVAAGSPFSEDSAGRIRRIGTIVIGAALVQAVGMYGMGRYFYMHISIPGVVLRPAFQFPFGTVLLGLIIVCLSEVFRYGARLQEEHDLTV